MKKLLNRNSRRPFSNAPGYRVRVFVACLFLLTTACADFSGVDQPLAHWTPELEQREIKNARGDRDKSLAVLLAFSGGGTRASAFSYGVLQELSATSLTTGEGARTVLQEVDVISSVSGGSFTAAYYGLHGEQIFTDFEARFLREDVEGALFRKALNPLNWIRLLSGTYGRSDLAADYYDKILFDQATFADIQQANTPLITLNATDLATGTRFPFNESSFDLLCAEFGAYPVARAVAASSAVPVVLSPVTLKNFAGSCDYPIPAWVPIALKDETPTPANLQARTLMQYRDVGRRPYLHLVDGGVSDNLGLRSFYNKTSIVDQPGSYANQLQLQEGGDILIISVNARADHKKGWTLLRNEPSLVEIISSVSADEISNYSEDTIEVVRATFEQLAREKSTPEHPLTFHFVNVSIQHVRDDKERDFLNSIGTNFDLTDEQVDRLIAAARQVLQESKDFQAFLALDHAGD
jgi:NTE family protein